MKFVLALTITLNLSLCLFGQIQFAGVNYMGTFGVNTNNRYAYLRPFQDTEFPRFQSMKLGPDGRIYFTDFNRVGVIETSGLNRSVLSTFSSGIRSEINIGPDGKIFLSTLDNKLFRIERDGSGTAEIASIPFTPNLAICTDGWLFGVTDISPQVFFKIRSDGSNYTVLRTFVPGIDGSGNCKLSFAPNNRLYGSFVSGGPNGNGTFFRIDSSGNNLQVMYSGATSVDAVRPSTTPVYQNGKVYVTSALGGDYGTGSILAVDTNSNVASKIFDFGSPGALSIGTICNTGLIAGGGGKLYGCTMNSGTVFSINEDGTSATVVYAPTPTNIYYGGGFSVAPILLGDGITLVFQSDGGGFNAVGYLYSVHTNGTNAQLVYNHGFAPEGLNPIQGLVKDASNVLFGVKYSGGSGGAGLVYKQSADGSGFQVIHNFSGNQARNPNGRLTLASDGMLYGVCGNGSNTANLVRGGAIYRLNTDGSGFQVNREFNTGTSTVCTPVGGFVEGSGGELYGIAQESYISPGSASIYRINKDGSGFSVIKTLNPNTEGYGPYETLTLSGNFLYGTCINGGSSGSGTAFRIQTNGTGFQVLRNFSFSGSDGALPISGLTMASNGRLYGIASFGGTLGFGTIYTMNPDGTNFTILLSFDQASHGTISLTKLKQATDGNLYGTTQNGGTNGTGTFFRYNISINTYTVIRNFDTDEFGSQGELIEIPFSATLPVNLRSFVVEKINKSRARLSWVTEKEINFEKYIVERSFNGRDFSELGSILPKPTTGLSSDYEWIDINPGQSKVYYRLKMLDKDNSSSYSKIRSLDFSTNDHKLAIYPNPAKGLITIDNEFNWNSK